LETGRAEGGEGEGRVPWDAGAPRPPTDGPHPARRPPARRLPPTDLGTHKPALASPWFAELFDVGPDPAARSAFFRWSRPMTADAIWLRISSLSFVASLPEAEREGTARPAVAAWAGRHAARFAPPPGGGPPVVELPLVTEAFVVRRRGGGGSSSGGGSGGGGPGGAA
jgi:hypothetical protein